MIDPYKEAILYEKKIVVISILVMHKGKTGQIRDKYKDQIWARQGTPGHVRAHQRQWQAATVPPKTGHRVPHRTPCAPINYICTGH